MSLYDPSYEDIVGRPEEILEDSRQLARWRRLRAFCLYGLHDEAVGAFTRMDDYLELPNGKGTSPESWRDAGEWTRFKWHCGTCGRVTQHIPKGFTWG